MIPKEIQDAINEIFPLQGETPGEKAVNAALQLGARWMHAYLKENNKLLPEPVIVKEGDMSTLPPIVSASNLSEWVIAKTTLGVRTLYYDYDTERWYNGYNVISWMPIPKF